MSTPVFSLLKSLDYADGAVAKKVVLRNNGGSIILLAVDKDQVVATHSVPADVLVHLVEGQMEFTLQGEPLNMTAGDAIVLRPGQLHSLRAITRFKVIVTRLFADA